MDHHAVVSFLWVKEHLPKDIHKDVFPVRGKNCLSFEAVYS
jgi:hypothetical protein